MKLVPLEKTSMVEYINHNPQISKQQYKIQ